MRSDKGASKARNVGMKFADGDILAFPDDDCWYPDNLLSDLEKIFTSNNEIEGITGLVMDEQGHPFSRFPSRAGFIQKNNAFERACLPAIFLRAKVVKKVGKLNENLGPGAPTPWQSGDETDYILRAIEFGFRLLYEPQIIVFHPRKKENVTNRAFEYGAGFGRVLRIHKFSSWRVSFYLLRPFGGIFYALLRKDLLLANYYLNSLRGRWVGWRSIE